MLWDASINAGDRAEPNRVTSPAVTLPESH
jgi:hypothetical protein